MTSPICIGHRGAKGYRPENTLPSFEYAIELGCEWVELDVYLVEGELLVIHDQRVDRTTDGSGEIKDLGLDYLRSLDAGNGARIPTLAEVLDLVGRRCRINVELKGEKTAGATCELLDRYCETGWRSDDFLLSSFSHQELMQTDVKFPRGALFAKLMPDQWLRASNLNAWSVNFDKQDVTPELVMEAHDRGYKVLVYTVNEAADITRMIECGVDGIFSDYPDRVLSIRSARA